MGNYTICRNVSIGMGNCIHLILINDIKFETNARLSLLQGSNNDTSR